MMRAAMDRRGRHTADGTGRPGRTRILSAMVGVAVLCATVLSASTSQATWTAAQSGSGTLVASTIPAPISGGACILRPGVLGLSPQITVTWSMPDSTPAYTTANIQYAYSTTGLLEPLLTNLLGYVSTTGPVGGVYTTVFASGLLSGLLGGSGIAAVRVVDPASGWTSRWLTATAAMELLGVNPSCVVSTV